jgi:ribose 5-phosphate isomerase B
MSRETKLTESRIRERVRTVVYRTLGRKPPDASHRALVTEADIMDLPFRGEYAAPQGAVFTPLARQAMMERQIHLTQAGQSTSSSPSAPAPTTPATSGPGRRGAIAVGSDHAGFALKVNIVAYLAELGYAAIDCGASSVDPVDYPDFALAVGELVAAGRAERGILIDGAGIGSSVAANKVPGVRAALCYDLATAVNSREHNDSNVLTLGAGQTGPALARQIVRAWLDTRFAGGRHARRVDKILEIERRYSRR